VLKDPRSTSEPFKKLFDPTGVNVSVKPPNAQVVPVHAPLNAPAVENVTVCAAIGSDPSATAVPAMNTARAMRRPAMPTSFLLSTWAFHQATLPALASDGEQNASGGVTNRETRWHGSYPVYARSETSLLILENASGDTSYSAAFAIRPAWCCDRDHETTLGDRNRQC
jgi:hypothetical protein